MPKDSENEEEATTPGFEISNANLVSRKRKYTMSPAALQQRKDAAKNAGAPEGNRNSWLHGRFSDRLDWFLKPCQSTCKDYPCDHVTSGLCKLGDNCLDAANIVSLFDALSQAALAKDEEDRHAFLSETVFAMAKNYHILSLIQDSIIDDGVNVIEYDYDKEGNIIGQNLKLHPSLLALPKLAAQLNVRPEDMMMTPKEITKQATEEQGVSNLKDLLSNIYNPLKKDESGESSK